MSSNSEIAEKCLRALLKDFDISVLKTYSTESFKAAVLPESLGMKERTKDEHLASGAKLVGNLQKCTLFELIEIFESGYKVTAQVRVRALLKDGTEWNSDAIFILTFNEEGMIIYWKEFVDSLELFKVAEKLLA
ncbi:hypothetical protein DL96DRAFT_1681291 [Flagelloscypha sp. PMI_526]|nr:hypothetical protein DL96DRAFT_1681291 [Flagelloscypha sp. PMI_526]